MKEQKRSWGLKLVVAVICLLLILKVAAFLWWGSELAAEGGSYYYLISGVVILIAGVLFALGRKTGSLIYLAWVIATLIWAFWEVGAHFWMLFPRIFEPLVSGVVIALATPFQTEDKHGGRRAAWRLWGSVAVIFTVVAIIVFAQLFVEHKISDANEAFKKPLNASDRVEEGQRADSADHMKDWTGYGGTDDRNSYVPYDQINIDNVSKLKVAWKFRTGDIATEGAEDQNTPLQVGDTVFTCSPHDRVFALDADSGKQRWTFDSKAEAPPIWYRCRSLGYADLSKNTYQSRDAGSSSASSESAAQTPSHSQPNAQGDDSAMCRRRIYMGTMDARIIALDAGNGKRCDAFGNNGEVDLKENMGEITPGFYMQTSGPTVVDNGLVIISGWVLDNHSVGEPSGVVRAYDADTGKLVWAWDLGNPDIHTTPPKGETYTRGTPNVWAFPTVDARLGLVYLPLGNATPDYWGGERSEASDKYNSSVVAVDIHTGRERWKFQTVHHDLWDYDVPVHPVLYDIPNGKGERVPALLQATKRGEIFVLDRRNGKPIGPVEERKVPTDHLPEGERASPTQPYSTGMPAIRDPELTERSMWGISPIDQLMCRVAFRKMRYEGDFTPQSEQGSLIYPSNAGGMNWGGMSVDHKNDYLIINDTRIAMSNTLIPRKYVDSSVGGDGHVGLSAQLGTPYGAYISYFFSVLGVPCNAPPYGTISAIDLKTRKIVWQKPAGTVEDTVPLPLHVPLGMPSMGGPLSTGGGLVFYSGTQDHYLRAYNVETGKEVWKARLPVGGQSTPMSYVSPNTHRQYVVVTASGSRGQPARGDYVIAYSLDDDND
ncbi:membrane-bound PQQ-dependent dehydrogenase, glucose/quinate/shikimate family [Carnimonas bestiolae]|uniref:membrane-bound PQQ-dependent dehydrogenase, glucose/quinate/shikimate family n=1 Tax=Carnimonas bestiolae TaxID=3402172 RepID=UPI003EDCB0D1